jgi:hypothetical protein
MRSNGGQSFEFGIGNAECGKKKGAGYTFPAPFLFVCYLIDFL